MIVLYVLSALLALYLIFIVGPATVAYFKIFGKRSASPLDDMDISKTYFAPYEKMMRAAADELKKLPSERIRIKAYDGIDLYADHINVGSDKTAVFFHGYKATPEINFGVHAKSFIDHGYNVLLVYMRGHSVSGGENNTLGLIEQYDVLSWVNFLDKTDVKHIVLYGISMGASTIAYASPHITSRKVCAMVMDCGFISPAAQISRDCTIRKLPAPLLIPVINAIFKKRFGLDLNEKTTDALKYDAIPVLFLHGTSDLTVTYKDSQLNYDACAADKKLILAEGLHHTLAFSTCGSEVREQIFDFLEQHINNKQQGAEKNE